MKTATQRRYVAPAAYSRHRYAESGNIEDFGVALRFFLMSCGLERRQAIIESERIMVRIDPTFESIWVDAEGNERTY